MSRRWAVWSRGSGSGAPIFCHFPPVRLANCRGLPTRRRVADLALGNPLESMGRRRVVECVEYCGDFFRCTAVGVHLFIPFKIGSKKLLEKPDARDDLTPHHEIQWISRRGPASRRRVLQDTFPSITSLRKSKTVRGLKAWNCSSINPKDM